MIYDGTEKSWTDICADNLSRDLLVQLPLILSPKPIELSTADVRIFPDTLSTDHGRASLLACHYDCMFRDEKSLCSPWFPWGITVFLWPTPLPRRRLKGVLLWPGGKSEPWDLNPALSMLIPREHQVGSIALCTSPHPESSLGVTFGFWKKWHSSTCQYFPLIIDFCPSLHFLSFPPGVFVMH